MNLTSKISALYDLIKPIDELVAKDVAQIWLDADKITADRDALALRVRELEKDAAIARSRSVVGWLVRGDFRSEKPQSGVPATPVFTLNLGAAIEGEQG